MQLVDGHGKPVFSSQDDMRKAVFNRFLNVCTHLAPAIAQKPLRKQLEDWLASLHPDEYNQIYLHIRSLDKRGVAVMAQKVVETVRLAHTVPNTVPVEPEPEQMRVGESDQD